MELMITNSRGKHEGEKVFLDEIMECSEDSEMIDNPAINSGLCSRENTRGARGWSVPFRSERDPTAGP